MLNNFSVQLLWQYYATLILEKKVYVIFYLSLALSRYYTIRNSIIHIYLMHISFIAFWLNISIQKILSTVNKKIFSAYMLQLILPTAALYSDTRIWVMLRPGERQSHLDIGEAFKNHQLTILLQFELIKCGSSHGSGCSELIS